MFPATIEGRSLQQTPAEDAPRSSSLPLLSLLLLLLLLLLDPLLCGVPYLFPDRPVFV